MALKQTMSGSDILFLKEWATRFNNHNVISLGMGRMFMYLVNLLLIIVNYLL